MQCVILAGGLATRMRPLTEQIPKSLLPVEGDRPFVDYQLQYLREQGIEEAVFCIGYKGEMIRQYVGEGSSWSLKVQYADEGKDLRGTGGALRLAFDHGFLKEKFFVVYGDSFLPIDFRKVWEAFGTNSESTALMTVMENSNQWDQSNACYSQGKVPLYDKRIQPKPAEMKFIDYGLSILERTTVRECIPSQGKFDLADVFHTLSLQGKLAGYLVHERFYEIGSFQGLDDFKKYIRRVGHLSSPMSI